MRAVIVKRDILTQLKQNGNLHHEVVKQTLHRCMELAEVPETIKGGLVDYLREHRPDYSAFGVYVSFFRRTDYGLEVAKYNHSPVQTDWLGDWFQLNEVDWDVYTIKSDFDISEMFVQFVNTLVRALEPMLISNLRVRQCYAILDVGTQQELTPIASLATFIGVEVPVGINLGLDWVNVANAKDKLHPYDQATLSFEAKLNGESK